MIQSVIELDLSHHAVQSALRDAQRMHRLVTGLLESGRKEQNLLYRVRADENGVRLLIRSDGPIHRARLLSFMRLSEETALDDRIDTLSAGQRLRFELLTMPYKKIADGMGANSRRRMLQTAEERLEWLRRKAEQNGFALCCVIEISAGKSTACHREEKGGALAMDAFSYVGELQITDADAFRAALRRGIGAGKAYGYGMLLWSVPEDTA